MVKCCKCCKGTACCGCCCGKRGATITFSLVGILLAIAVIVPPVYIYMTDRDFDKLFPILRLSKRFLLQVTEAKFGAGATTNITMPTSEDATYGPKAYR